MANHKSYVPKLIGLSKKAYRLPLSAPARAASGIQWSYNGGNTSWDKEAEAALARREKAGQWYKSSGTAVDY